MTNENGSVFDEEYFDGDNETLVIFHYPLDYRIIATLLQSLIFILGVSGNIVVILVIFRTRSLQSSTYVYLASLAFADFVVLITAVPESIVVHHIGNQWLIGQIGCSVFVFSNFFGINAGSLSILAFTVEQYVTVCGRPFLKVWLNRHTNGTVWSVWIFTLLYCAPWLGLTEVRPNPEFPSEQQCDLRLSRQAYLGLFGADFILFYLVPLLVAAFCYSRIAIVVVKTGRSCSWESPARGSFADNSTAAVNELTSSLSEAKRPLKEFQKGVIRGKQFVTPRSRNQVLRMLVVIVVLFALAWLPYRGLLVYNSFAAEAWNNMWYSFFAKTLIFLNSAVNPFLYTVMSRRFRMACKRLFWGRSSIRAHARTKTAYHGSNSRSRKEQDPFLLYV